MKKTVIALSLAALSIPALAQQKKDEPAYEITGNFGLVSDYRFRGVSQTNKKPAVQGGLDIAFKNGIYLGTWASNVSQWASTDGAGVEIDLYGGYKGSLPMGISFDVGFIAYQYPGTAPYYIAVDGDTITDFGTLPKQNTRELYFGLSKGPVSYKLSRTMSKGWFGIAAETGNGESAKGSLYHDLTVSYPLNDKLTLSAHAGYQNIKARVGTVNPSFKDYKVGASYDLGDGYAVGLAVTKVSFKEDAAKDDWFTYYGATKDTKLYGTGTVLSLTKTF